MQTPSKFIIRIIIQIKNQKWINTKNAVIIIAFKKRTTIGYNQKSNTESIRLMEGIKERLEEELNGNEMDKNADQQSQNNSGFGDWEQISILQLNPKQTLKETVKSLATQTGRREQDILNRLLRDRQNDMAFLYTSQLAMNSAPPPNVAKLDYHNNIFSQVQQRARQKLMKTAYAKK
ncbi:MAG: hypothetical protein EZS28_025727 [Streblomastix strix]|uniref:Uncharacterized protein n=1 Tax=Streblomastix strix TaxID=222440 RepID=A0A5J4V8D5_9EUKA|nr:MAG: hypothetical protein EZS28_025727 [Streblomastix strix]